MPWRHRVHRWFTEGRAGAVRSVLLSVVVMCIGMIIVFGVDLANGLIELGWSLNTFHGFALGLSLVAGINIVIHMIALDYREEQYRRVELPRIWRKD